LSRPGAYIVSISQGAFNKSLSRAAAEYVPGPQLARERLPSDADVDN